MGVQVIGYEPKYWPQIRDLAERVASLSQGYDYMSTWGACIYPVWEHNLIGSFPYHRGLIALDGEQAVGYLGAITSIRYDCDGVPYTYVNATNWMMEPSHRRYFFPVLTEYLRYADVYSDFSASEVVSKSLHEIYKFQYIEQMAYRFYPIPYVHPPTLNLTFIQPEDDITDRIVKLEYADHYPYGVRGIHISDGTQEGYILYHRRGYCVRIFKSTNRKLLEKHTHEIFWNLQKDSFLQNRKEDVARKTLQAVKQNIPILLECPGQFLRAEHISHPFFFGTPKFYFSTDHKRLFLNRYRKEVGIDFLYSEICVQYESRDIAMKYLPEDNEFQHS